MFIESKFNKTLYSWFIQKPDIGLSFCANNKVGMGRWIEYYEI